MLSFGLRGFGEMVEMGRRVGVWGCGRISRERFVQGGRSALLVSYSDLRSERRYFILRFYNGGEMHSYPMNLRLEIED